MTAKFASIPLWARDGSVRDYTIVDADDFAFANQWRWKVLRSRKLFYAVRNAWKSEEEANQAATDWRSRNYPFAVVRQ